MNLQEQETNQQVLHHHLCDTAINMTTKTDIGDGECEEWQNGRTTKTTTAEPLMKRSEMEIISDYRNAIRDVRPSLLSTTKFPRTPEEVKTVEEILEKEMESLSIAERDKILFDMHGLSYMEQHEDSNKIDYLLDVMETEVQTTYKKKDAYIQARSINPSYVTNRKFRLMFLRSTEYDPKLAAEKLLQHFEIKSDVFGNGDILGRDVKLSDLSTDDMDCLKSGFIQICPLRDVSGRPIFFISPRYRNAKTLDNAVSSDFMYNHGLSLLLLITTPTLTYFLLFS